MSPHRATFPEAWSTVSAAGGLPEASKQFTGQRMERILSIVLAVGAAALGAQTLVEGLGGFAEANDEQRVLFAAVLLSLAAMILACVAGWAVKLACGFFAVVYIIALALWASMTAGGGAQTQQPWIFFLVNVATVAAILAFRMPLQITIVVLLPFLYGFGRLSLGGFSRSSWVETAFDVSFTLIFGIVLLALAWVFRSVAAGVDAARGEAVRSFAAAAAEEAAEEERVALAALMHDSVLAALLAAERAESPREKDLAVAMAREALTRLANTEGQVAQEGSDAPVGWDQIVVELRRMLSEYGADAVVEEHGQGPEVTERLARAVVLAARQACLNALEHAHGRGLHVLARARGEDGFDIVISDTGEGFDPAQVPADRLGIRASIVARMAAVAGVAEVTSDERGTVVTLSWPAP